MVTISANRFNVQMFYILTKEYSYVFCMDFTTNCDYLPMWHEPIGCEIVYSAVRNESLKIVHAILSL